MTIAFKIKTKIPDLSIIIKQYIDTLSIDIPCNDRKIFELLWVWAGGRQILFGTKNDFTVHIFYTSPDYTSHIQESMDYIWEYVCNDGDILCSVLKTAYSYKHFINGIK